MIERLFWLFVRHDDRDDDVFLAVLWGLFFGLLGAFVTDPHFPRWFERVLERWHL